MSPELTAAAARIPTATKPHARRDVRQDEVHEDRDLLAPELASRVRAGARAHDVGPFVENVEKGADREEQEHHGDRGQYGYIEGASAVRRVPAGEQPLRRVLIETQAGNEEQHHSGQGCDQGEGRRGIERKIEEAELVFAGRGRGEGSHDFARGGRDAGPKDEEHGERRPDIEQDLDEIGPDDRAEAADEGEGDAKNDEHQRGDEHIEWVDVREDDHRDGDRRQIKACPAREDPADQVHAGGSPHRANVVPVSQQFVDCGDIERVEAGNKNRGDDVGGDDRAEIACEIGIVAAKAVIRRGEEGRRRLGGREHRYCEQPDRHPVAGQEIVLRVPLPPGREDARSREKQDICRDDRPIQNRELRRHVFPSARGFPDLRQPVRCWSRCPVPGHPADPLAGQARVREQSGFPQKSA